MAASSVMQSPCNATQASVPAAPVTQGRTCLLRPGLALDGVGRDLWTRRPKETLLADSQLHKRRPQINMITLYFAELIWHAFLPIAAGGRAAAALCAVARLQNRCE